MIAILCASILLFAAGFHAYWALGGRRGYDVAIPQFADGRRVFEPSAQGTLVVAALIAVAGLYCLVAGGLLALPLPASLLRAGTALLAAVFLVRALGWFEFAGWFKRVRTTPFAKFDTWVYCPLCLVLGAGLAVLAAGG